MSKEHLTPWKPGQSGNPSGRPKGSVGMRAKCRALFDEYGIPLFEKLLKGEEIETKDSKGKLKKWNPTVGDRVEAAKWLADRGYGKAVQAHLLGDGDEGEGLADDIGEVIRKRIAARMAAQKQEAASEVPSVPAPDDKA